MTAFGDDAYSIFDDKVEGFAFACPGVLLSSTKVRREWVRSPDPVAEQSHWRLSYQDGPRQFVGKGEDIVSAYLDLIRARMDIET